MVKWIVREVVGQAYTFEVEAETLEESIHTIKLGKGGKCVDTHEIQPQYTAYPKDAPSAFTRGL